MHRNILMDGKLIAQFFDLRSFRKTEFPTPPEEFFQIGLGFDSNERKIRKHLHKEIIRTINLTSEFLYVIEGSIDASIFSEEGIKVDSLTISANQALLQFRGGHEFHINSNTKYFELKQGPYLGNEKDKEVI